MSNTDDSVGSEEEPPHNPLHQFAGEEEIHIRCPVEDDMPEECPGWEDTVELDEPVQWDSETGSIRLSGWSWECPECGNPHDFELGKDAIRVSNLV